MRIVLCILLVVSSIHAFAFELIAHRGMHQTYFREGLTNATCTAERIEKATHSYQENTLESIEAAFNHYADVVELDIHPTTEADGVPDELVVFHDWGLLCRTNARCDHGCKCNENNECLTFEQSQSYILGLDIGHGYTFDNGETYPFRGQYIGKVPTFAQVLDLLQKYPSKKLLVNVKGNMERTTEAFLRVVEAYPESVRQRLHYPYRYGMADRLDNAGINDEIIQADKACLKKYILTGWYGNFPEQCRNKNLMIPIRENLGRLHPILGSIQLTSVMWGWPDKFIERAKQHGTRVYASQVDSIEEYNKMMQFALHGIMTNKIELIGPKHHKNTQNKPLTPSIQVNGYRAN
jgi:glycerophosphoryl diester phosphodiesterase